MTELSLTQEQVLALRVRAHNLPPVVLIGAAGLSEAVLQEIDRALRAHGLVKIRGGKSAPAERDALFRSMAGRLGAARIQAKGHTFVLFRPVPENDSQPAPKKTPSKKTAGTRPVRAPRAGARRAEPRAGATPQRRTGGPRPPQR